MRIEGGQKERGAERLADRTLFIAAGGPTVVFDMTVVMARMVQRLIQRVIERIQQLPRLGAAYRTQGCKLPGQEITGHVAERNDRPQQQRQ